MAGPIDAPLQGPVAHAASHGAFLGASLGAPALRPFHAAGEAAGESAGELADAPCHDTGNVVSFEAAAAARQTRVLARAGAADAIFVESPTRIGQTPRAHGAPWDFAAAVRAVEREFYGPELRVVEGGAPRISTRISS